MGLAVSAWLVVVVCFLLGCISYPKALAHISVFFVFAGEVVMIICWAVSRAAPHGCNLVVITCCHILVPNVVTCGHVGRQIQDDVKSFKMEP